MLSGRHAGVRTHVESTGHGDPVVLLHGWAMHAGVFEGLAGRLAARYRVHAVDLPGHGWSGPLEPYTLDEAVAAVARALAAESRALTVLGWSLGGQVALRWAELEPRRIARLVLVGTTPRFVASADWPDAVPGATLARFGAELQVAWKSTVERFLALQVRGSEHGRAALAALRRQAFARGAPAPRALRGALDVLASADLRAAVPSIAQEALVIGGSHDRLAFPAAGEWLAGALPAGRYAPIRGAGHAPFLSHPQAFEAALCGFLDDERPALRSA